MVPIAGAADPRGDRIQLGFRRIRAFQSLQLESIGTAIAVDETFRRWLAR